MSGFYVKVSGLHEFLQPDIIGNRHLNVPAALVYTTTTRLLPQPRVEENHTLTGRSHFKGSLKPQPQQRGHPASPFK